MNKLILGAFLVAVVVASPLVKRQAPSAYVLPDGAELIVGSIQSSFNCDGHIYGYYADVPNKCQIFHVCVPDTLADGTQKTRIFSFFCGNQTVFDQENLVCSTPEAAFPCDQAASRYSVNENFGKTDRPLQRS